MKTVVKPNPENADTKKKQVTEMFDGISKSYDALNRIITLGIDVLWRKRVVAIVQKESPKTILDIATGTADLAVALASIQPERIVGLDISPGMLALGKDKIKRLKLEDCIEMQLGDSEALPFPNSSFDAVTVSFGVRNFEHLEKGLQEIERVLKPKGKLVILETAVPKNKFISLFIPYIPKILCLSWVNYLPKTKWHTSIYQLLPWLFLQEKSSTIFYVKRGL